MQALDHKFNSLHLGYRAWRVGMEPLPQCKLWITSPTHYPSATAPDKWESNLCPSVSSGSQVQLTTPRLPRLTSGNQTSASVQALDHKSNSLSLGYRAWISSSSSSFFSTGTYTSKKGPAAVPPLGGRSQSVAHSDACACVHPAQEVQKGDARYRLGTGALQEKKSQITIETSEGMFAFGLTNRFNDLSIMKI